MDEINEINEINEMKSINESDDLSAWLGSPPVVVTKSGHRKQTSPVLPTNIAKELSKSSWLKRRQEVKLGNSLEMWRATRLMTQADLAGRVGVSRKTISAIENNRNEPVLSLALAIAEVFEAPVEDIFSLHRPKFPRYPR